MADVMMDKLLAVTNQLLDLGKRNRLLNYRDQGMKTLAILNKNIEEIFRAVKGARDVEIFNTDQALTNYHNEQEQNNPNDNTLQYEFDLVYSICRKLLDRRQILCYKKSYTLQKTLKSLYKEFTSSLKEKGMNSLYISFGFIHYFEEGEEFLAPLLLIPIEMDPESGDNYIIRQYEDDIMVNPTFNYYLNSLYHVNIPRYDDEAYGTYLDKVKAILPEGMFFEDACAIGIYSFYKMSMYTDIMNNKEKVLSNNNIRILLGDETAKSLETQENQNIYPVVNCDSSQLGAIQMAANGKSFCLQGPPGSGKSQTITNIIASLLGQGKKILFVSEKISALNVVFDNLRRVKLSDFAIELHSNKANKLEFINNLYETAIAPKYDIDLKTTFLDAKYSFLKANLSSYERVLHENISSIGISLVDLYELYLNLTKEPLENFNIEIANFNLFDLEENVGYFEDYARFARKIGYDYRDSTFYNLNKIEENYALYSLNKDLEASIYFTNGLLKTEPLTSPFRELGYENILQSYKVVDYLIKLTEIKDFRPFYLNRKTRERVISLINKYYSISKLLKRDALALYNKDVLKENLDEVISKLKNGLEFKNKNDLKEGYKLALKYRLKKEKPEVILPEIQEINALKKNLYIVKELTASLSQIFGDLKSVDLKAIILEISKLNDMPDIDISKEGFEMLQKALIDTGVDFHLMKEYEKNVESILRIFNLSKFDLHREPVKACYDKLKEISDAKELVTAYASMTKTVENLKRVDALDFLNEYLDRKLPLDDIAEVYRATFIKKKIDDVIASSDLLSHFQAFQEDKIVADFRELDEDIYSINRDYIISVLSKKRPDAEVLEGSEFKVLTREHEKKRRQMPIRSLLEKIFDLVLDIKPVFLMSPLSVSTYLDSRKDIFDCVVFDEASQIFASDALGSIYRAKQCIIIGDTKQMPPTNFFHASVGEEADEEEDEKEYDLESVLDKATQMFETTSLKWHYRSRSEELITFSNNNFYNSSLISVPQSKEHEKGFGVDFYYVKNGIYDMATRTNPIEAQYICDMVFDHFKHSKESLGVVAFSNVQADLIQSLVDKRLKKEPQYEQFFNPELNEPFFVKNLETVQGDERDRIIFSICYAYNKDGKFYQRFGPLNNQGGERRLNVAVTRAKFNVSVVSSVKYTDILTKTNAQGVLLLRSYLEFAENVVSNKNYSESSNQIISSIKEYIEALGDFEVQTNYGSSAFKVDLAIKYKGKFILAIMTDAKSGGYSNNLTDKYRLEKILLERLGWRYYKVYTASWMDDNEVERIRIKEALDHAVNGDDEPEVITSNDVKEAKSFLIEHDDSDLLQYDFENYIGLDEITGRRYLRNNGMRALIEKIIEIESPIHKDYLYEKIATILNEKNVDNVKEEVDKNLPKKNILYLDGFIVLNTRVTNVKLRLNPDRPFKYIYFDELIDGLYSIISKNNGITADGAFKSLTNIMGYPKLLAPMRQRLEDVLKHLVLDKEISINETGNIKLVKNS